MRCTSAAVLTACILSPSSCAGANSISVGSGALVGGVDVGAVEVAGVEVAGAVAAAVVVGAVCGVVVVGVDAGEVSPVAVATGDGDVAAEDGVFGVDGAAGVGVVVDSGTSPSGMSSDPCVSSRSWVKRSAQPVACRVAAM